MLGRIRKMILAANDVRDLHLGVVDDVDEMENPRTVGTANGHVRIRLSAGHVELNAATDDVIHDDFFARETKANGTFVIVDAVDGTQFVQVTFIDCFPLTLKVRSEVPTGLRSFIPIESEPVQPIVNGLCGFARVARPIGVFDPQNQRAARVFGVEPIKQRGASAADVEITGRRWSETDTNSGRHGQN